MSNQSSVEDESERSGTAESDEESTCSGLKDDLILNGEDLSIEYYGNGILPRFAVLSQLEAFINAWSSDPSADRGRPHTLRMTELYITPSLITRLVPLLLPYEGSTSSFKFHSVAINSCRFMSPATPRWGFDQNEDGCTPDDKNCFLSALAQYPGLLQIDDSNDDVQHGHRGPPEILSGFVRMAEIDSFKVTRLRITDNWRQIRLSELEYIKLGSMIQGNEHLKDLVLWLQFRPHGIPQEFLNHLANAVHLRSLSLDFFACPWDDQDAPYERAYGPRQTFRQEGVDVVERLLRNPQSQLINLHLFFDIEDHHLIALAQLLPNTNIRTLELVTCYCGGQSLLEFARQFPNMLSLNSLYFSAGEDHMKNDINEHLEECGDFFLQGLIENPSITRFNLYRYFPQRPLMVHYLSLNRAGRKLLSPSQEQRIPDGLWPLVLERAGASGNRDGPYFIRDRDGSSPWAYVDHGPVNAVFFFLQNCPKLLSYATGTGG